MIDVKKLIKRCNINKTGKSTDIAAYILGQKLPYSLSKKFKSAANLPLDVFTFLNNNDHDNHIFNQFLSNSKTIDSKDKPYKYYELNLSYKSKTNKQFCIDDSNFEKYSGKSIWTSVTIPINGNSYHMFNQWSDLNTGHSLANFALKLYELSGGKFFIKFLPQNKFELCECSNTDVADEFINDDDINSIDINILYPKPKKSEKKKSDTSDNTNMKSSLAPHGRNIIIYGAPGTGKSHTVDKIIKGIKEKGPEDFGLGPGKDFRTTFHPDTDYATFVGCYKPSMNNNRIEYHFKTQVFLKAYKCAWEDLDKQVYLVIEEINRGNCAQIFGDIFQLLDRDQTDGHSKYLIIPDDDIISELFDSKFKDIYLTNLGKEYKKEENLEIAEKIEKGVLALPHNLTILATMNTSDQSLFPMDSAFKRRWEWKYIKIDYENERIQDWIIKIGDKEFKWKSVLKGINDYIRETKKSTDKQMGEFFIIPKAYENNNTTITFEDFRDKVLFYLFNDVFKGDRNFFSNEKDNNKRRFFEDFFSNDLGEKEVCDWFAKIGIIAQKSNAANSEEVNNNNQEEIESTENGGGAD